MINKSRYEIRIKGNLDQCWQGWFEGMLLENQDNGEVLLSGSLDDQSALYGVLSKIRDLNLTLISVNVHSIIPEEK